jgi:DNA-binding NtrC family response regulator
MNKTIRCLLVEDSEDDTLLVLAELCRGGYTATHERVETPEAMRAALDRQPWDIVIADYKMPRFSGLAALEILKASGKDLSFIVVSGTIGEDAAVKMMQAGANDYIVKGKLARLVPAVERELRDAEGRRQPAEDQSRPYLFQEPPEPIHPNQRQDGTELRVAHSRRGGWQVGF